MIQRHQDYQLSIPSLPAGGLFDVPLQLDSDAPFALRRIKTRNLGSLGQGFRFRTPKDRYQSTTYVTDYTDGQPTTGKLIYPQMIYPPNASIIVDIENNTGETITNARVLFRGSKYYQDGSLPIASYPPKLSTLPGTLQVPVLQIPVTGSSHAVPGLNTAAVLNNILNIGTDADFAIRYLAADPFAIAIDGGVNPPPQVFNEMYVLLRDESKKGYSNEPIHVDDLFGQLAPATTANNESNRFLPGVLTPEIYLQRTQALYFDVFRDDSAMLALGLGMPFPVDVYFRFQGAKVFLRD